MYELINPLRDNAIAYKAQRDKNARELTGERIVGMLYVSVMLLRSMQNTRRWLMLKLKMMLCVMMLPSIVVGCTSKRVYQSVREATTASGVDNTASPTLRNTMTRLFLPTPQREADHYAKTTGRGPEVY